MIAINSSDLVKVKLTEHGVDILRNNHQEMVEWYVNKGINISEQEFELELDNDGYYVTNLWYLAKVFGNYFGVSTPAAFENNVIYIERESEDASD